MAVAPDTLHEKYYFWMRASLRCLGKSGKRGPSGTSRNMFKDDSRALSLTDVTGDPEYKNFVDLLQLPSKSESWVARQALMREPHTYDAFFATRPVTNAHLMRLLKVQSLHGDVNGARDTLQRLPPSLTALTAALTAAARVGDCVAVEEMLSWGRSKGLGDGNEMVWSTVAACYARAGKTDEAVDVVRRAKQAGVVCNEVMYGALLTGFARRGQMERAEQVWHFLKTSTQAPPLDSVLYTAMIHACAKAGQAERALMLLDEMRSDGLVPTEVTFNAALLATARRSDMWKECKDLFQAMKAQGMDLSEYTFNTMLLCASRAGDVASARNIVSDMKKSNLEVSKTTMNTCLNTYAYALSNCKSVEEKKSLLQEAEGLVAEIESVHGTDKRSHVIMLHVYASGHFVNRAKEEYAKLGPNEPLQAVSIMLKLWSEIGRPKELMELWEQCKNRRPDFLLDSIAYRWVIEGFARVYWISQSIDVVEDMMKNGLVPQKHHLRLLRHRCKEMDLRKAYIRLEDVLKIKEKDEAEVLKLQKNDHALMMQKLAGEEVRPFLLPFPTLASTDTKTTDKRT